MRGACGARPRVLRCAPRARGARPRARRRDPARVNARARLAARWRGRSRLGFHRVFSCLSKRIDPPPHSYSRGPHRKNRMTPAPTAAAATASHVSAAELTRNRAPRGVPRRSRNSARARAVPSRGSRARAAQDRGSLLRAAAGRSSPSPAGTRPGRRGRRDRAPEGSRPRSPPQRCAVAARAPLEPRRGLAGRVPRRSPCRWQGPSSRHQACGCHPEDEAADVREEGHAATRLRLNHRKATLPELEGWLFGGSAAGGWRRGLLRARRRLRLRGGNRTLDGETTAPATGMVTFEEHVQRALDEVPEELARRLRNVAVVIEDENPQEPDLYGLFDQAEFLPAKVTIYRLPLEADFPDPARLEHEIRVTVLHELAHYFGIDEERLAELGYE